MVKQVFISHAEEDTELAHRLADDLGRHGISIWIMPESIQPGDDWVEAINRGLSASSHVVVLLTPSAITSQWVRIEMSAAIDLERKEKIQILPLDVQPCQAPPLWRTYQAIPFSPRHYEAGLLRLLERLGCERPETTRATPGYILDQASIIVDQIRSLSPPYTPAQLSCLRHQMDQICDSLQQLERQTASRAAKVRIRSLLGPVGSREAASCVNFQAKARFLEELLQRKYNAEYVAESLTQLQRLATAIADEIEQILKLA